MVDRTKRNHYNANRQAGARRPSWAKDQIGGKGRGHCPHSSPFPVAMTKGSHLFPSRTQKLSPSVPKVLGWTRPGRIGRCRIPFRSFSLEELLFLLHERKACRGAQQNGMGAGTARSLPDSISMLLDRGASFCRLFGSHYRRKIGMFGF